jgi:type IV secretory pathway VirB10-like protein
VADDPEAMAAARAHPESPLRRPIGSKGPFELEPTALPSVPDNPKHHKAAAKPHPAPKPDPPSADRSALEAAEAALQILDRRRKREEARLREAQDDLNRQATERQAAYVAARKAATASVVSARQAYRKAGGRD